MCVCKAPIGFGKHNELPLLSMFFVPLIHVSMSLRKNSIHLSRWNFIQGYLKCQYFSYMHYAAGFSALPPQRRKQKEKTTKKHDFCRFNITGEWQI